MTNRLVPAPPPVAAGSNGHRAAGRRPGFQRAPRPTPPVDAGAVSGRLPVAIGAGGRLTLEGNDFLGGYRFPVLVPPPSPEQLWRWKDLATKPFDQLSPEDLTTLIVDLSPAASMALHIYIRMCNPGWEIHAYRPTSAEKTVDPRAEAELQSIFGRIGDRHGSLDVPLNRLFINAYLRGAIFGEWVLDEAGRESLDLATPDPAIVRFARYYDPVYGVSWQSGQFMPFWGAGAGDAPAGAMVQNAAASALATKFLLGQNGRTGTVPPNLAGWVPYLRRTIRYIPNDPAPNSPYGRPLILPAVFPCLFLLAIFHDLRRVVQQQGWPRLDISLSLEKALASIPESIKSDPVKLTAELTRIIGDIQKTYNGLQPDQAWIHTDDVTLNRPQGTVDSSSLGSVDALIRAIERELCRALKVPPFLLGISESNTETQANRQSEIFHAGIEALQHPAEALVSYFAEIGLEAKGIVARVEMRFAQLRAAEALRNAQVEQQQIVNSRQRYDAGWVSQDEAAQAGAGRAKADSPIPRIINRGETVLAADVAAAGVPEAAVKGEGAGMAANDGSNRTPVVARALVEMLDWSARLAGQLDREAQQREAEETYRDAQQRRYAAVRAGSAEDAGGRPAAAAESEGTGGAQGEPREDEGADGREREIEEVTA